MRVTAELLKEFEFQIEGLELRPSRGGVFEVEVDGELTFSKRALGRHAEVGEVTQLVKARLGK